VRIECIRDFQVCEKLLQFGKVAAAIGAEEIQNRWRLLTGLAAAVDFAVQYPQRIVLIAAIAVLAKRIELVFKIGEESGTIAGTALGAADGIDLQLNILDADALEKMV
jgi:hypothetical protein